MNSETIGNWLVTYGPTMVLGVAAISLGLTAVVFGTFVLNELFFKRKDADHGHGSHSHGSHH